MELDIKTVTGGPLDVNTYVVGASGSNQCVLIDPGAEYAAVNGAVCGREVKAVLLTHAHFDHTGALRALHEALPAVPIYVHPADTDETRNMSHGNLIYTDTYEEGDTVRAGALEFTVLETPGHTPGGVVLLCGEYLFCGDTLFAGSIGRTDLEGGSSAQMAESLRKLAKLPIPRGTQVLPGHGEFSTFGDELDNNYFIRSAVRGNNDLF